jgi:cell division septation protein DedD
MASTTQDDGFHEIQLNGKQLVFLFMAVTVVSVVIFLSGVLVGRGVRIAGAGAGQVSEVVGPSATGEALAAPPVETGNTPITTEKDLKAPAILGDNPPAEGPLKDGDEPSPKSESVPDSPPVAANAAEAKTPPSVPTAPAPAAPAAAAPAAAASSPPPPAAPSAPTGKGLEIQLSAFRDRKGADVLANRLNTMGFTAYVVPPSPGAPSLFRVRVGKFKERREAEAVAARLKKEKFEPWILP